MAETGDRSDAPGKSAAVKPVRSRKAAGAKSGGAKKTAAARTAKTGAAGKAAGKSASGAAARAADAPHANSDVHTAEPLKKSGQSGAAASKMSESGSRARPDAEPDRGGVFETESRGIDLVWRLLGLIGFGFLSNILLAAVWILAAVQYLVILIRKAPEPQLAHWVGFLSAWLTQIFAYMAGNTDAIALPFPFSSFPERDAGEKTDAG